MAWCGVQVGKNGPRMNEARLPGVLFYFCWAFLGAIIKMALSLPSFLNGPGRALLSLQNLLCLQPTVISLLWIQVVCGVYNILSLNYLYYSFIFNAHEDNDFFLTPLFPTVLCSLNRGDEQCMLFEFIHSFIHWIYLFRNWTWNISSFLLSWENSMFPIPLLHQKFMVFNVYGIYHHVFTLLK